MWRYLFSLICVSGYASQAVLTDIEGTTTSISFVHDVLFPYAKSRMPAYLKTHQDNAEVRRILAEVRGLAEIEEDGLEPCIRALSLWMEQDRKITPLKFLQGMVWQEGYERGDFYGHIYKDAYEKLLQWKNQGIRLYVYSSGSVLAQKLLFSHTEYGDLTPLFSDHFDTRIGGKKERASYVAIADLLGLPVQEVLFLSDSLEELDAARAAGMQTILLCRNGAALSSSPHPAVTNFTEILFP
jgi:enolase-phosphatase E1